MQTRLISQKTFATNQTAKDLKRERKKSQRKNQDFLVGQEVEVMSASSNNETEMLPHA